MTDYFIIKQWESAHGEVGALAMYAQLPDPDGTAPEDYKLYARNWGHPSHQQSVGEDYALAA